MGQGSDEVRDYNRPGDQEPVVEAEGLEGGGGEPEPEQIRSEIEATRADMSETIDAIQEKLNPDTLKEQAKEAVREATIGRAEETVSNVVGRVEEVAYNAGETARETGSSLMDTIRQNPVPAMLAGLGLGWLFMNRTPSRPSYRRYEGGRPGSGYGRTGYSYQGEEQGRVGQMAERVGERADEVRERAGEAVGSAGETAREASSSLMDTIRENPVPSALIGIGLSWLLVNRSAGGEAHYGPRFRQDPYYGSYEGYYGEGPAGTVRRRVGETAGRAQETVGRVADQVQSTAGEAVGQVQETAGQVADQVQETAGQIRRRAQYQAGRLEDRFQEMLDTNPMGVGAAALAVGMAAGMAFPETRREQEMMGEARENFMRQAREKAGETMEKVQRVAEDVQDTAQQSASEQGLA